MPQKSYTLGNLLQDCLDCDIRKSDIRQFFDLLVKTGAETPQKQENATL